MKKILYSILAFSFFATSCNTMQDIEDAIDENNTKNNEVDLFLSSREVAPAAYTLTDEDYELSSNDDVVKYKNFSKYAPAKDNLPEILYKKFSGADAQAMMVTYNYYASVYADKDNAMMLVKQDFDETSDAVTFSTNLYPEMGQKYANFSSEEEAEYLIAKYLDSKVFPEGEVTVQYLLYRNSSTIKVVVENNNGFSASEVTDDTAADMVVSDQMYTDLGQKYGNFNDIYQANAKLIKYVNDNNISTPYIFECEVYSHFEYPVFYHNGEKWLVKKSVMPVSEELNYSLDSDDITKSYWWADPAIKITLTNADYDLFPATSGYKNFDLRSGKDPGTDVDKRVEMIGQMLDTNHGPIVEDQQYLVSYAYYDGSNGVASDRIIKTGGTWKMYESK